MALTFEYTKNLSKEASNTNPLYVRTPYIVQEPKGTLFQYYIDPAAPLAFDKEAKPPLGQYDEVAWSEPQRHLSVRAVARIGVKQFPQLGAIGFYKSLYTSQSYILAPVHAKRKTFKPPTLALTVSGDTVQYTLVPPKDVTYTCYRLVMRSGFFAAEYTVYDLVSSVAKPLVNGEYVVTAIGYNELTGTYSSPSNVVSLTVTGGRHSWEPESIKIPMSLADLTDVSLVDLLNAQMLRYNAKTLKWENVGSTAVGATRIVEITLLASDWLTDTETGTHRQLVTVEGTTELSKIDLQPSTEQLVAFHERDVTFTTANEDGKIAVYAIGDKPTADYTIQATVSEVVE